MSPEAQRAALLERVSHYDRFHYESDGTATPIDPLADLNFMHVLEATLKDGQPYKYFDTLHQIVTGNDFEPRDASATDAALTVHATAAQRAEAFLKTIGLWDASK